MTHDDDDDDDDDNFILVIDVTVTKEIIILCYVTNVGQFQNCHGLFSYT